MDKVEYTLGASRHFVFINSTYKIDENYISFIVGKDVKTKYETEFSKINKLLILSIPT